MNVLMMSESSKEKLMGAYPEELEEGFHLGFKRTATTIKFNHRGTLFAVGCFDGLLKVFDSDTLSLVTQFKAGRYFLSNVEWFRNYNYILCANGNEASIWNINEQEKETIKQGNETKEQYKSVKTFQFSSNITRTYICPSNQKLILVCTEDSAPILLDCETDERRKLPITILEKEKRKFHDVVGGPFSPDGKYILIGNTVGHIVAVSVKTLKVISHKNDGDEPFHISGEPCDLKSRLVQNGFYFIKQIVFSKKGKYIAVNTNASIYIYLVTYTELENRIEFISITTLRNAIVNDVYYICSFLGTCTGESEDSDYLIATKGHNLLVYTINGDLIKMLDCPQNEIIISLECHPQTFKYIRPLIVTGTTGGHVLFWTKTIVENWSAFSPEFGELERNEYYVERENEYDEDCEANNATSSKKVDDFNDPSIIIDIFKKPNDDVEEEDDIYIPRIPLGDGEEEQEFEFVDILKQHSVKPQKKRPKKTKKKQSYSSDEDDYQDDDSSY